MKTTTPLFLLIFCLFLTGCGEDERLGTQLSQIKFYDFIYNGSGYYAEKTLYYDNQGRISKTVSTNLLGHTYVADYTYEEDLLTVHNYSAVEPTSDTKYRLKFNGERLTRFVIAKQLGDIFKTDSVDFLYEAGKLSAIQFGETSYPIIADDSGNIIYYQFGEEQRLPFEYDNSPNPLKGIPSGFIFLSFEEGIPNRLWMRNIVEFMSPNNWKTENKTFTYQDGKVIEIKETMHGTWTKARFSYENP